MTRFNSVDRRLDRMAACTGKSNFQFISEQLLLILIVCFAVGFCLVLIMEAFSKLQYKFDYSIVGHDGGSAVIPFVEFGKPPSNQQERMNVIEQMYVNSSFCQVRLKLQSYNSLHVVLV